MNTIQKLYYKIDFKLGLLLKRYPKPDSYLNGRPVYIDDVVLDGVDSYIQESRYSDTLELLDDNELDQLTNEEQDFIVMANLEEYGYFKK